MTAWPRVIELSTSDAAGAKVISIARSRTEPASRVERARILLGYGEDPSFFAVARALELHHQTVQRCVERAPGLRPDGGARRSSAARQRAQDHHRGQSVAGVAGLPEGEGSGISPRVVDDPASGPPRA